MIRPFYRQDPIFKLWNHVEQECHRTAKLHGVDSYLIDLISLNNWINNGCRPAVTNSIVLCDIPSSEKLVQTSDSFYGVYYYPYSLESTNTPSKDYNCFINRMDPIRQSWFYQLVRRKLLNRGYVSFNMDISRIPEIVHLSPLEAFQKQFEETLTTFKPEHEYVKSLVPYRNFHCNSEITDIVLDSKFSIVLETYFDQNDAITYSEKIFRALQLPRPWMLYSHCHGVKYLRQMGFDVLDDVVDHNCYDGISNEIQRQVQILNLMENVIDQPLPLKRCIEAAKHNQQLLKKFNSTWQDDYLHSVEQAKKYV